MKKNFFLFLLLLLTSKEILANHTKGGWMYYEYLGPGGAPNTNKYRITLKFYTACDLTSGQFEPTINFSIFDAGNRQLVYSIPVTYSTSDNIQNCNLQQCHPCISLIPSICYKITTYSTVQDLPRNANGYIVSYQRCCRISSIVNLEPPSNNVGETWTVSIPGFSIAGAEFNSSAQFAQNDTAIICQGGYFTFDFSATDPDGDSLVYNFIPAYTGGSTGTPAPNPASTPPYTNVVYAPSFSGFQPLGNAVNINHQTGIVSGIAPGSGIYVVTVVVSEYIRGTSIKIAEVRKSLHIEVADCSLTQAKLDPEYVSCDGFTVSFFNNGSSSNIQTYDWDFGDGNTSTSPTPTHTYADSGLYTLKLTVNRNLPCSDSATSIVKVYPGFFPDFSVLGQCANFPIKFFDRTRATYPTVNFWRWDFGDITVLSDTSRLQNPSYTYPAAGTYHAQLIVGSNKGCIDTLMKDVEVLDKPSLSVTHDTLICTIDTLQLNAVGTGSFFWAPNYMINNTVIGDPLVSPDITTTYHVTLTDPFGCVATDSVKVKVVSFVTLQPGRDTSICTGDPARLNIISDGLHFLWTPAASLNDSSLQNPIATPPATTTYHVIANIGKCTAQANITVTTIDYPNAQAGPDAEICYGNSTQLHASGGSIYAWSPTAFLSNSHIADPFCITPTSNVRYIVTVRDTLGCPKPVRDTLIVKVDRLVPNAGPRDTSVVEGQPLQLNASGGTHYLWWPATWLDNPFIQNPIALPKNDIEYVVKVSNDIGCFAQDTILVRLYKLKADLYVPSAFSPNGDGLNDLFRPILLGMKSLDLFRVYNRWGEMIYSGADANAGWDGKFKGKEQEAGSYVWYAEGTDYTGLKIKKKGYVVLIR